MKDMFTPASGLGDNTITGGARKSKMAINEDRVIHLVWSEKNGKEWDILYKRSTNSGLSWSDPITLFGSGDENFFYEADITAGTMGITAVPGPGSAVIRPHLNSETQSTKEIVVLHIDIESGRNSHTESIVDSTRHLEVNYISGIN